MLQRNNFMLEKIEKNLGELEPTIKSVEIVEGDIKLDGKFFLPPNAEGKCPAVLLIHGWKSSQGTNKEMAEFLAKHGNVSLTFNLREHGIQDGNQDSVSREDYLKDTIAAYGCLLEEGHADLENITVIGSSFGGYLATLLSEKRRIKNLILRAPADYKDEGFDEPGIKGGEDEEIMKWRGEFHHQRETASLQAMNKFTGSVLVVESGRDDQIPHQTIMNYVEAVSNQKKVELKTIENASHSIGTSPELKRKFESITIEWLKKHKEN